MLNREAHEATKQSFVLKSSSCFFVNVVQFTRSRGDPSGTAAGRRRGATLTVESCSSADTRAGARPTFSDCSCLNA